MFDNSSTFGPLNLVPCSHCGGWHTGTCSKVKSVEYWPDGTIKKVEYKDDNNTRGL